MTDNPLQTLATLAGSTAGGAQLGAQLGGVPGAAIGGGIGLTLGVASAFLSHKETSPRLQARPNPKAAVWEANPPAQHIIGHDVSCGGKVLYALHKIGSDESEGSKRLDLVIGLSEGPLSIPATQMFLNVHLNGRRYRFVRHTAPNDRDTDPYGRRTSQVAVGRREHWEPNGDETAATDRSGSLLIKGCVRIHMNTLADGTEGWELHNWAAEEPDGWDDGSQGNWQNPWDFATHKLMGISWAHVILNFTEQGIRGNRWSPTKRRTISGITSKPTVSIQVPRGRSLTDEVDANAEVGSNNSAKAALWVLRTMVGLDNQYIDTDYASRAIARCNLSESVDIPSQIGNPPNVDLMPFAMAGVVEETDDPLRILQSLETVWNGSVAFQDGKVALLPGDYSRSAPDVAHVLTHDDLIGDLQMQNTIQSSQRYNSVSMAIQTCRQSIHNGPISIRDQQDTPTRQIDAVAIIEEMHPFAYVNDYYQLQQIAKTRAALHAVRLRGTQVATYYTRERASWRIGDPIKITVVDSGVRVPKDFVITNVLRSGDYMLVFEVEERPATDPWTIAAGAAFDYFTEVEPPLIDRIVVPIPANVTITRSYGTDNDLGDDPVDTITAAVDYPGPGFSSEIEITYVGVNIDGSDVIEMREFPIVPRFDDQGKFIYVIEYRVGASIAMRLRVRHYTEGMLYGEWSDYTDIGTQVVDDAPAPNVTAVASVGGYALNNNDANSVISDNKVASAKIRQVELDSSMAEIADTVVEYSWLFLYQPFIQQGLRQGVVYSLSVNYVNVLGADGAATTLQVETLSLSDVISVDRGIDFTAPAAALDLMVGVAIPAPGITLPAAMVNFGSTDVEQAIGLGADPFTGTGNNKTWDGAILIDGSLVDGGGEAWLRSIRVNIGSGAISVQLSATETGSTSSAGPEFIDSVEASPIFAMFTEAGGSSFLLAGPNAPGNERRDTTEPYSWTVSDAIAVAFFDWINSLGLGEVTLTISSRTSSVAVQYEIEGVVPNGLVVDTNTRIVTGQVDIEGYSVFGWKASAGGASSAIPIHVNVEVPDVARRVFQEAYYASVGGSVGDQPAIPDATDDQKVDFTYRPDNVVDFIPIPTEALPNTWKLNRLWSNVAANATDWAYQGIVRDYSSAPRIAQEAFYLSADGSVGDLPNIAGQSDEQKTDLHYRPDNVIDSVPDPTVDMPNVWRLTRVWSSDVDLTVEWGYSGIAQRFSDPSASARTIFQEAYYAAAQGSVGDLPAIPDATDDQKVDFTYRPDNVVDFIPVPTRALPNTWKLNRLWSNVAANATDWAYQGIAKDFSEAPRVAQETYYASTGGSVGDQPSLDGQTDAQLTNFDYRPVDTDEDIPDPTIAMPDIWKLTRVWSPDVDLALPWDYNGISVRYSGPTGLPPEPSGVGNSAPMSRSIRIYWNDGQYRTEVEIEINEGSTSIPSWQFLKNVFSTGTEVTVGDLSPGDQYRYRLRHINFLTNQAGPWYTP